MLQMCPYLATANDWISISMSGLLEPKVEQITMTNYSHSYISKYQECPLSCQYKYELRLRKREEGAGEHHLVFSRAYHEALAELYHGDYYNQTATSLAACVNRARDLLLQGYPRQLKEDDLAKTSENGIKSLFAYVQRWKDEDRRWKVLEVETLDHQEDGFVVKLDLVVQDLNTDQIFGMDHKVTGAYLNYDYWSKFEPNSQIVEYVRYVKEKFGYCDGFIVNAISLRYLQRASKNGPAGPWFNFERQTFNVNGRQMEADLQSRRYWTERIEQSKASGLWGMNTSQCKFCEYRDLCKAGWFYPDDAELIDINYRRICGRWFGTPLAPCQLDREHEGEHCAVVQVDAPMEIEVEV